MIFKVAYSKDDKYIVKIDFGGDVGEKWADTTPAVVNYAKKAFKDGDEVDVVYTVKDGKYNVTRITKKSGNTSPPESEPTKAPTGHVCSDCGKPCDEKYPKCWDCNQKNPKVQASIKRQAIGHMTSRTLISLQGQVDINNVSELIKSIYKTYVEVVG